MPRKIDWDKAKRQKRGGYVAPTHERIEHRKILKPTFPMTDTQQKWYEEALRKLRKQENDGLA
jgi:hypothetical protein